MGWEDTREQQKIIKIPHMTNSQIHHLDSNLEISMVSLGMGATSLQSKLYEKTRIESNSFPIHMGILTYDLMKVKSLVRSYDFSEHFSLQFFNFLCFGSLNRFENLMHRKVVQQQHDIVLFSCFYINI